MSRSARHRSGAGRSRPMRLQPAAPRGFATLCGEPDPRRVLHRRHHADHRRRTSTPSSTSICPPSSPRGRRTGTVPLVIWAHGGIVSEQAGLTIAGLQVPWWLDNGAYPLHFVWETGFVETLKQLLGWRSRPRSRSVTARPAASTPPGPPSSGRDEFGSQLWTAVETQRRAGVRSRAAVRTTSARGSRGSARRTPAGSRCTRRAIPRAPSSNRISSRPPGVRVRRGSIPCNCSRPRCGWTVSDRNCCRWSAPDIDKMTALHDEHAGRGGRQLLADLPTVVAVPGESDLRARGRRTDPRAGAVHS